MRLLSIKLARSIWLLPFLDLNPRGRNMQPMIPALIERYKFAGYPKTLEDLDLQKGVKFGGGTYIGTRGYPVYIDMTIFNDGLIADNRSSTMDSDAFLADGLSWIMQEYGCISYEKIIRAKMYVSELYVHTEHSLKMLNPKIEHFERNLSEKVSDIKASMEISGISFLTDPGSTLRRATFRLEREEAVPFSENRYYSIAPLQTDDHLMLLEQFEALLQ